MKLIRYEVIYNNGEKTPVAKFQRDAAGKFKFEYLEDFKYEFPGFNSNTKVHTSDTLWAQIAFRVPNLVRSENPDIPLEELLQSTEGKLVTDHFAFVLMPEDKKIVQD